MILMSTTNARPVDYSEEANDEVFPRWRRPFFNPYPSWIAFLKKVYRSRHGIESADQLDKRPFFTAFPNYNTASGRRWSDTM
ncbi:unnamed protein product [Hydatigera taeniaeformis]|uniref:Myotubularin phosphatase domain-containing protein n=1 Tax=Hydatigena taeniaeformis TaxID=6205 RepID=A0A0R3WN00_HYDTA|nr:unnamed protein product [Hydatigera taeniaeformis]